MAKDGVKRGFFFYLGLFLLILLGIASVLMIVMMFMPKTSILGIQYFTNSKAIRVDATTDEAETPINFDYPNFNSVVFVTDFADVTIQKNNEFERNGIYFVNKSRGFVSTKKANDFEYSVKLKDGVLTISLAEEKAFLYFSKEIEVVFQISNENVNPLADKNVSIYTNSGDVSIGGDYGAGQSHALRLGSLNIESGKGSINLSTYSPSDYPMLSLKTSSGDINVAYPSVSATHMNIETTSGDISATKLGSSNGINITSKKGKVVVSEISGSVNFEIVNSYVKVATVQGTADFSASAGKFDSADVNIKLVTGNFIATEAANADFNLGTVRGTARIETESGDIVIDGKVFSNWILKTTTGSITANLNANATQVDISTEKGRLNITLPSAFSNVMIANKGGKTYLTLPKNGKYTITCKYYDSDDDFDLSTYDFDNINLNLDMPKLNPIVIENGSSAMSSLILKCNNIVDFAWEESA